MGDEEIILCRGTGVLRGEVQISGAKNSALELMAASILAAGPNRLINVPHISDITVMGELLEGLGGKVCRAGAPGEEDFSTMIVDTAELEPKETPYDLVSRMRASIVVLGPLIARFGCARVAMPGGCEIGARKIDMHISGLEAMGVVFGNDHGVLVASTPNGLHGAHVVLDFPSVGATENIMMAATCAEGITQIENAAREPEIEDLAALINAMGGRIRGAGSSLMEIEGVRPKELHACTHRVIGDRIEAGTFLVGGVLCGGPLTARGIDPSFLRMALRKMEAMGATVETGSNYITVSRTGPLRATDIQTLPHPGFPTDLQAQFLLLASLADGVSIVSENVFENRFMFASELMRMGADVSIEGHHAMVRGVDHLQGADVITSDLRAGAALVLAGLVARGYTRIFNIGLIDRGYENFVEKLNGLGAQVYRLTKSESLAYI